MNNLYNDIYIVKVIFIALTIKVKIFKFKRNIDKGDCDV